MEKTAVIEKMRASSKSNARLSVEKGPVLANSTRATIDEPRQHEKDHFFRKSCKSSSLLRSNPLLLLLLLQLLLLLLLLLVHLLLSLLPALLSLWRGLKPTRCHETTSEEPIFQLLPISSNSASLS